MSKNKKKRRPIPSNAPIKGIYSKEYNLIARNSDGKLDVIWGFAHLTHYHSLPFQIAKTIPNHHLNRLLKKQFLRSNPTEADIRNYDAKILDLKTRLEQQFSHTLSHCRDISQILNVWSPESQKATIDTFDFREYLETEDITDNALNVLQENSDISMFWSSSEYFDIILSDSVFYRVHRVVYDAKNNGVTYNVCEYHRVAISDTETITVPLYMASLEYIPADMKTVREELDSGRMKISDNASAEIKSLFSDMCQNADCKLAETLNLGQIHLGSISSYMINNHDNLPKPTYRLFKDMISHIANDIYNIDLTAEALNRELKAHVQTTTSVLIAAILVANSYLKQNKLSRPISAPAGHKIEIVLQNKPTRKTRILGNKIKITSETRPETPDKERIFRYHTPEWGRKAHLRHLKNGKVAEIPAGKCQRRCVDMSNIKSKLPEQAVDYIIKPDANGDNDENKT